MFGGEISSLYLFKNVKIFISKAMFFQFTSNCSFPFFQMQSELDRNISKELNNGECTDHGTNSKVS